MQVTLSNSFPHPVCHAAPEMQSGIPFIWTPPVFEFELEFVVDKLLELWKRKKPSVLFCFNVLSLFLKGTCFYCSGNPVYC